MVKLLLIVMIGFMCTLVQAETRQSSSRDVPKNESTVQDENRKKPKIFNTTEDESKQNIVTSPTLTLKLAFKADPRLFPYDIDVEVDENAVQIDGTVTSQDEKVAASEIALRMADDKTITNNIIVDQEMTNVLAQNRDQAITIFVQEQFDKSQTLQESQFQISTNDGVVSLHGTTRFQVILLEAAQAAQHVPGVKAVKTDTVTLEAGQ
ncbi:BON domain-containing protein [Candidatus Nitrospira salsa]